jgi:hypothetical protein
MCESRFNFETEAEPNAGSTWPTLNVWLESVQMETLKSYWRELLAGRRMSTHESLSTCRRQQVQSHHENDAVPWPVIATLGVDGNPNR